MKFSDAPQDQINIPVSHRRICNQDPVWARYIMALDDTLQRIATKVCSTDEGIREDCLQEARFELAKHYPEDCNAYRDFQYGLIEEPKMLAQLSAYCRMIARNSMLSYLDPYPTGNWNIGRTRTVKDKKTGITRKIHIPARFSSLEELIDYGMQVDEHSNISWMDASTDGIDVTMGGTDG